MIHNRLLLVLVILGCTANSNSSLFYQNISPSSCFYNEIPDILVVENKTRIIGTYNKAKGFGSSGIEIKEGWDFQEWEPGIWDSSINAKYKNSNWTFQDGLLKLEYLKKASKRKHQKIFDVVFFENRIFLIPIENRQSFIDNVIEYNKQKDLIKERIISFEFLISSYFNKIIQ